MCLMSSEMYVFQANKKTKQISSISFKCGDYVAVDIEANSFGIHL